jgi:2-dehydro-3-deoxyphosphooctonate aldolase (KDO 8-P synthase)
MGFHNVRFGDVTITDEGPFFIIAGPCVIENEVTTLRVAEFLRETKDAIGVPILFKASYDKANRTALDSFRGPGIGPGLEILGRVRERTGLPVISDVHSPEEAQRAAQVLDVLQIPAFLCRQTDLLVAASRTGRPVNVKKGQFMAPWDMERREETDRQGQRAGPHYREGNVLRIQQPCGGLPGDSRDEGLWTSRGF